MRKIIIVAVIGVIASSGITLLLLKSKKNNSNSNSITVNRYETKTEKASNNQGTSNSTSISTDDILNKIKKTNKDSFSNYSPAPAPPIFSITDTNHPSSSIQNETKEDKDKRMGWWREDKIGVMINWGVYAIAGGLYQGIPINLGSEWEMFNGNIPIDKYKLFSTGMNPVGFDATKLVKELKNDGMKYIIFTTKHHDGFAMFETKINNWNIVDSSPYKKDIVKKISEACKSEGVPMGFYYSQNIDWINGGNLNKSRPWDTKQETNPDKFTENTVIPQLKELLKNYDSSPKVLLWDAPSGSSTNNVEKIRNIVKELSPKIIQNDLLGAGATGDFKSKEFPFGIPSSKPTQDTEIRIQINKKSAGYKVWGRETRKAAEVVAGIADAASKGCNTLLSISLDSNGDIPTDEKSVLNSVGTWLKKNGEAIYGSNESPLDLIHGSVEKVRRLGKRRTVYRPEWDWRLTSKPNHYYLILLKYPEDGKIIIPDLPEKIKSAKIIGSGEKVGALQSEDGLEISELPKDSPDPIATVIDLTY